MADADAAPSYAVPIRIRGGINLAQVTLGRSPPSRGIQDGSAEVHMMFAKRFTVAFAAVLLIGITACQTVKTTESGVVGVNRKQRMLVSEEEVEKGADTAYAQEKQKAQSEGKLNSNSALTSRVRNVSQKLIPGTGGFRSDAPNW
jgi:hypothetical protein